MPNSALPPHLQGKRHDDYWWIFKLIPRAWTSYKLFQPPIVIFGYKILNWCTMPNGIKGVDPSQKHKWSFYFSIPYYFTITFPLGWYIRIGCRWDSVDFYYTIPSFAIKKVEGYICD